MSRHRSACMAAAALLCLTLPRQGAAQETSAGSTAQREAALQALRPGHLVRISASGVRDTGRVAVVSPNGLALRRRTGQVALAASSIDSLWTWKSNVGNGALTGTIVLGVVGALWMYASADPTNEFIFDRSGLTVAGGVAGALVGLMSGAIIGSVLSRWQLVHPGRPGAR